MSVNPVVIANEFIRLRQEDSDKSPFTTMALLKLVYLAHAWSLGIRKEPLSNKSFEAWQFGPVQRDLYFELKDARGYNYEVEKPMPAKHKETLSDDDKKLIEAVYNVYGKMGAWELSERTHQENTPWSLTWANGRGDGLEISNNLIAQHMLDHYVRD